MLERQERFATMVTAYGRSLYRYCYRLCRDPDHSQDLVQETFARAWKGLDGLKDDGAARAWLITTLRRENARTFSRKRLDMADIDLESITDSRGGYDTSTEAWQLRRALLNLPARYREPLILQVLYGYSCEEIAARLDLSASAVMTRLFRAKKQMKSMLTDNQELEMG